jgi:DNA-binding NtrC family response regulator
MPHALVIDDDPHSLNVLADLVRAEGFVTVTASTLAAARREMQIVTPDVVLCELRLPDGSGTDLLRDLGEPAATKVILVTDHATVESAVEALRRGADDYLTKPIDFPRLKALLEGVQRTLRLEEQVVELRQELRGLGRFGALVGTSKAMNEVYDLIERVAPTNATVLIHGESGTGKELVAHTIHRLSRRAKAAYLPLNCGAVSPSLIESELFGHERGSFTGAMRQHLGYFERATGGTLFLDEITEMTQELQVKLLRVLEAGLFERVGGNKPIQSDVRVIAATNRDPEDAVQAGKLRLDLYFRLEVFPIYLPPLRAREGDIELLAVHFLEEFNRREDTQKRLSQAALDQLEQHRWPGNVREMRNIVERSCIMADDVILPSNLPGELGGESVPASGPHIRIHVGTSMDEAEKTLILATLNQYSGDKRQTATTLGISLKTLYNRLNRYAAESRDRGV